MNQFPRYCEERKIALVEKSIAAIDEVPRRFAAVETLLLSNNLISDLGQIAQFRALKSLSLANNRIEKLTQLLPLRALKELEMVYFDGCPVCLLPTYRDYVIDMLPSLRSLDAKDVYEQERTQAKLNLKQLNRMMELLIVNEEEGTKLEHFHKQLAVHREMLQKGIIKLYSGARVASFLAWVPLDWSEELKMQVLDTFENKAKQQLRRNVSKDCLWAYTQNLMEQQQIVARLMILCEQGCKETLNAYISREALVQAMKTSSSKPRLVGTDLRLSHSLTIRSESPQAQPMSPAESLSSLDKQPVPFTLTPHANSHKNLLFENEVLRKKLLEKEQIVRISQRETDEKREELAKTVEALSQQCKAYEKERLMMNNKLSIAFARNAVLEERVSVLFAQGETGGPIQPILAQSGFNLVSQEVRNRMLKHAAWKNWKQHHQTAQLLKSLESRARQRLAQETQSEVWSRWYIAHIAAANRPIFSARRAQNQA
jgi:DNA-binding XRE family transcriptional regulator